MRGKQRRCLFRVKNGFTLIEILIVMALIGLSISIVIPNIGKSYDKIKFRSDVKKLSEFIQKVRFQAFYYQKNIVLSESRDRLLVTGMTVGPEEVPDVQVGIGEEIRFMANGVSSGGEILIYFQVRAASRIRIEKFNGRIHRELL
jgi:prepilin-type N-terminal cleavage/methylation domain-containing protein